MKNSMKFLSLSLIVLCASQASGMARIFRFTSGVRTSGMQRLSLQPMRTKVLKGLALSGMGAAALLNAKPARAQEANPQTPQKQDEATFAQKFELGFNKAKQMFFAAVGPMPRANENGGLEKTPLNPNSVAAQGEKAKDEASFAGKFIQRLDSIVGPMPRATEMGELEKTPTNQNLMAAQGEKIDAKKSTNSENAEIDKAIAIGKALLKEAQDQARLEFKNRQYAYYACMRDTIANRGTFKVNSYNDACKLCAFRTIASNTYYPKAATEKTLDEEMPALQSRVEEQSFVFPNMQTKLEVQKIEVQRLEKAIDAAKKAEASEKLQAQLKEELNAKALELQNKTEVPASATESDAETKADYARMAAELEAEENNKK